MFNFNYNATTINMDELHRQAYEVALQTGEDLETGAIEQCGISAIVEECLEAKSAVIDSWNGMTRIEKTIKCAIDLDLVKSDLLSFRDMLVSGRGYTMSREKVELVVLNADKNDSATIIKGLGILYGLLANSPFIQGTAQNKFNNTFGDSTFTMDEARIHFGFEPKNGEKVTRMLVRLLKIVLKKALELEEISDLDYAFGLQEIDVISQNYSKLVERFKSYAQEKTVYLSCDIRDYLRCSYGYGWQSCHRLGGEWGAGCINYAISPNALIAYVEAEDGEKLEWRQMVYMNFEKKVFVGSRQYKGYNDRYANAVREMIQEMYSTENFDITTSADVDNLQELTNDLYIRGNSSDYAYNDIKLYSGIDRHIWVMNPEGVTLEKRIDIQHHYTICVDCGEKHYSDAEFVNCEECRRGAYYCEVCGEYHREDDVRYLESEDGMVCDSCLEEYFFYCNDCEEYHRDSDGTSISYSCEFVCSNCLEENYTYCEECECYEPNDRVEIYKDEHGWEHYVCEDCKDRVIYECEYCGEEYYLTESWDVLACCEDCHEVICELGKNEEE